MIKQTINYTDYNGNPQTEDFYFNLTKPELIELEVDVEGGLGSWLESVVASESQKEIIETFKRIILLAYGRKSVDGKQFLKSPEMAREFEQHAAFAEMYMMLATDATKASVFITGCLPKDMQAEAKAEQQKVQDKPTGPPPIPPSMNQ